MSLVISAHTYLSAQAAPKIESSNVGFRLLELMGWADGDRIGLAAHTTKMNILVGVGADADHGGAALDAPLTAVVKTTKLGLGAANR